MKTKEEIILCLKTATHYVDIIRAVTTGSILDNISLKDRQEIALAVVNATEIVLQSEKAETEYLITCRL